MLQKIKNWIDENDAGMKLWVLALVVGFYLITMVALIFIPAPIGKEAIGELTDQIPMSWKYSPEELKQEIEKQKVLYIKKTKNELITGFSFFFGALFLICLALLSPGSSGAPWDKFS